MSGGSTSSSTSSGASSTAGRPGTSASATPVSTSRIELGILSRAAATATAATTNSSSTRVWMVEVMRASALDPSAVAGRTTRETQGPSHDRHGRMRLEIDATQRQESPAYCFREIQLAILGFGAEGLAQDVPDLGGHRASVARSAHAQPLLQGF